MTTGQHKLESYLKEVGNQIRKFRKDQNWSLEELGLRIGLDRSDMHSIEAGKRNLTLRTILKLAIALEKSPFEFLQFPFDTQSYELGSLNKAERVIKKSKKKPATKKQAVAKRKH